LESRDASRNRPDAAYIAPSGVHGDRNRGETIPMILDDDNVDPRLAEFRND
jgi:hypothetical protein